MINPNQSYRYPFDPKGIHRDNRVENEPHLLDGLNGKVFQPNHGTFYTDSVVITFNGEELVKYQDYRFEAMHGAVVEETGKDAATMIRILKPNLRGTLLVTYQVVGGQYSGDGNATARMLGRLAANDNRRTHWNDIVGIPEDLGVLPRHHLHHWKDLYGFGPFYNLMVEWVNAVKSRAVFNNSALKLKLAVLEQTIKKLPKIDQEKWDAAIGDINANKEALATIQTEYPAKIEANKAAITDLTDTFNTTKAQHKNLLDALRRDHNNYTRANTQRVDGIAADIQAIQTEVSVASNRSVVLNPTAKSFSESVVLEEVGKHGFKLTIYEDARWGEYREAIEGIAITITGTIADRLNTLDREVAGIKPRVTTLENNVTKLTTDHNTLQDQVNTNETLLNNTKTAFDQYRASNNKKVDDLRKDYTALATKVNRDIEHLNEAVQNNSSDQTRRLDRIERDINDLSLAIPQEISNVKQLIQDVEREARYSRDGLSLSLNNEIIKVARDIQDTNFTLSDKINAIEESSIQINEGLQGRISLLESAQTEIINKNKDQDDRLSNLERDMTSAQEDITPLISGVESISAHFHEQIVQLGQTIENNQNALSQEIGAVNDLVNDKQTQIDDLKRKTEKKLTELEGGITSHTETINEIRQTATASNEKLNELKQQQTSDKAALEQAITNAGSLIESNKQMAQDQINELKQKQERLVQDFTGSTQTQSEKLEDHELQIKRWKAYQQHLEVITVLCINDREITTPDAESTIQLTASTSENGGLIARSHHYLKPTSDTSEIVDNTTVMSDVDTTQHSSLIDVFSTVPHFPSAHQSQNGREEVYEITVISSTVSYLDGFSECGNIFELYEKIKDSSLGGVFLNQYKDPRTIYALAYFIEKLRYKTTPNERYTMVFVANRNKLLHVIQHRGQPQDFVLSYSYDKQKEKITNYHCEGDILPSLTAGGMEDIRYRNTSSRVALGNLLKNDELYMKGTLNEWKEDWLFLSVNNNEAYPVHDRTLQLILDKNCNGLINTSPLDKIIAIHRHPIKLANDPSDLTLKPLDVTYTSNRPHINLNFKIVHLPDNWHEQLTTEGNRGGASHIPGEDLGYQFTDIRGSRPVPTEINPISDRYYRQWQRQLTSVENYRQATQGYLVIDFTRSVGISSLTGVGQFCVTTVRDTPDHIQPPKQTNARVLLETLGDDIKSFVRRYITEQTKPVSEGGSQWDLSQFREQPGTEDWSNIRVGDNDELIAEGVILQTIGEGEKSVVFAPSETITVTSSQIWRIPPQYIGRKARIVIQAQSIQQGNQVIHSAIREKYLIIPESGNIKLTIGPMTSFGDLFSVNNQQEYSDAIANRALGVGDYISPGMITIHV